MCQVLMCNGPEFVAEAVRKWIDAVGARTAYIEPGSPWEYGYVESFNARLRDELFNGEIFYTLKEAQIIIEQRRQHYNQKCPHSAVGYRPPAPEALIPMHQRPPMKLHSVRTDQTRLVTPVRFSPGVVLSISLFGFFNGASSSFSYEKFYGSRCRWRPFSCKVVQHALWSKRLPILFGLRQTTSQSLSV